MEIIGDAGLERLLDDLVDAGAGDMALPVNNARHLCRLTLQGALERGWDFEQAWSAAMSRLQPSQAGGSIDAVQAAALREDRQLLEEDRPLFQAIYEGREPTTRERAQRLAAVSTRCEELFRPQGPVVAIPVSPLDRLT